MFWAESMTAQHDLQARAAEVAGLLRTIANENRLLVLCMLAESGEAHVSALAEAVGLSQSALSQHLARMRAEGLLTFRREGQTIWYRIADPRVEDLLSHLHRLFCRTKKGKGREHVASNHHGAGRASKAR